MEDSEAYKKSKKFALRIVKLCRYLEKEKHETILSKQILRCGTSIGANLAEAKCAIPRPDFLTKVYIAFKECSETIYWLGLLHDSEYLTDMEFASIDNDANELYRMLSSITKTTRENNSQFQKSSSTPNSESPTPNP